VLIESRLQEIGAKSRGIVKNPGERLTLQEKNTKAERIVRNFREEESRSAIGPLNAKKENNPIRREEKEKTETRDMR